MFSRIPRKIIRETGKTGKKYCNPKCELGKVISIATANPGRSGRQNIFML
jgi:hypothetical protein